MEQTPSSFDRLRMRAQKSLTLSLSKGEADSVRMSRAPGVFRFEVERRLVLPQRGHALVIPGHPAKHFARADVDAFARDDAQLFRPVAEVPGACQGLCRRGNHANGLLRYAFANNAKGPKSASVRPKPGRGVLAGRERDVAGADMDLSRILSLVTLIWLQACSR